MSFLRAFVRKYLNQPVDFDGVYGAECVDLFRQYCKDLNIPRTESIKGAGELFSSYEGKPILKQHFQAIPASGIQQDLYPRAGDCIIWDKNPTYGHVAICIEAEKDFLLVFEQHGYEKDDSISSVAERSKYLSGAEMKLNAAHIWAYSSYSGILGWLRPRGAWVS